MKPREWRLMRWVVTLLRYAGMRELGAVKDELFEEVKAHNRTLDALIAEQEDHIKTLASLYIAKEDHTRTLLALKEARGQ